MIIICLGVLVAVTLMLAGLAAVRGRVSEEAEHRALWQCLITCPLHAEDDDEGPPCADPACPWRDDA